jgi:hypothetical protein
MIILYKIIKEKEKEGRPLKPQATSHKPQVGLDP